MMILIVIAAFVSTFLGGLFALRFKDKLHLILGFSAGAVIGVAFFDLIPEALELAGSLDPSTVLTITALGFVAYMLLDRFALLHNHHSEDHHGECTRGKFGAASLAIHSFIDGAAIGLAFQVSQSVGLIVATAVLVHDFSDGVNTVNLILKSKGGSKSAMRWLFIDALAPVLGMASTLFFTLPEAALGVVLAGFAGFFLYIGASDLLPESHHGHPTAWTTFATILGMAVLYGAIKIAGV
ncbi:MAG: ZIP family metal transporter [Candidatus Paceibacterota bacterium]|jgi:ZIP family zinc transporter